MSLSEFDIQFENCKAIKVQVLSDFVYKMALMSNPELDSIWSLWVDGASNVNGSGAGIILIGHDGLTVEQPVKFDFKASNNQAEYKVLITSLCLALDLGVSKVTPESDS
jgi:hypothetical protein